MFQSFKNCHSLPPTCLEFVNFSQHLISGSPDGYLNILPVSVYPVSGPGILTRGHIFLLSLALIIIAILLRILIVQV